MLSVSFVNNKDIIYSRIRLMTSVAHVSTAHDRFVLTLLSCLENALVN
jgi:hypothetical protein